MTRESLHLSVDDLDALLDGHLDLIKLRHIEMCDECREFARAEQELSGSVSVASLTRLEDILFDPQGRLDYELRGARDAVFRSWNNARAKE